MMDESTFEIDPEELARTVRRFPSHRRDVEDGDHPDSDVSYLTTATSAEFGRHVWDESGQL
jgi:hypothetical protein